MNVKITDRSSLTGRQDTYATVQFTFEETENLYRGLSFGQYDKDLHPTQDEQEVQEKMLSLLASIICNAQRSELDERMGW